MENNALGFFHDAVNKLREANEELCRPEEDVVSYLVCKNSQAAIEKFLKGFLLSKGMDPQGYKNISSLFTQCVAINPAFENLDLSDFTCRSSSLDTRSCGTTDKVSRCYQIAENLESIMRKENYF